MIDKRVVDWCNQAMTVQEHKARGATSSIQDYHHHQQHQHQNPHQHQHQQQQQQQQHQHQQQNYRNDILNPEILENDKESSVIVQNRPFIQQQQQQQQQNQQKQDSENLLGRVLAGKLNIFKNKEKGIFFEI